MNLDQITSNEYTFNVFRAVGRDEYRSIREIYNRVMEMYKEMDMDKNPPSFYQVRKICTRLHSRQILVKKDLLNRDRFPANYKEAYDGYALGKKGRELEMMLTSKD